MNDGREHQNDNPNDLGAAAFGAGARGPESTVKHKPGTTPTTPDAMDDAIGQWHASEGDMPLHEWLGMSRETYAAWVEGGRAPCVAHTPRTRPADFEAMERAIAEWHDAKGPMPLHEWLGMSVAEYKEWLASGQAKSHPWGATSAPRAASFERGSSKVLSAQVRDAVPLCDKIKALCAGEPQQRALHASAMYAIHRAVAAGVTLEEWTIFMRQQFIIYENVRAGRSAEALAERLKAEVAAHLKGEG